MSEFRRLMNISILFEQSMKINVHKSQFVTFIALSEINSYYQDYAKIL